MAFFDEYYVISNKPKSFNPYNIITFDTEASRYKTENGEIHKFFNVDFYDGINHYYSENLDDVIFIIKKLQIKYKRITLFAHNISYDLRILHLLKKIIEKKFLGLYNSIKLMDKIVFIKFQDNHRKNIIQFADSMNYFRTSLEELGSLINENKLNVENYNLLPKEWNKILKKEGEERVKKDTEILYKILKTFFTSNYAYGITLASTSFNTFRRDYLKHNIYFPKKYEIYAESSYKGGIVMPYILCKGIKLRGYDINSLYPFVMSKYPYSVKFHSILNDYQWIYDDIKNENYNYLLNVDYFGDGHSPIYSKFDNKLIPFLSGNEWITGKEYMLLYEYGFNIKINQAFEFHNEYLFKDYINEYYNKRLNSKIPYEKHFLKILMNSLYGKFGQHKSYSKIIAIDEIENPIEKLILKEIKNDRIRLNGKFYSKYDSFVSITEENMRRYNILIASEITANARVVNYRYSNYIGWDNLYYTDTDSFFTDKIMNDLIGDELGKMKIEKEGLFTIYAPKDYSFYGKCNHKDCEYCHSEKDALHIVLKGVNSYVDENNNYRYEKWSKIKYKNNDDVFVEININQLKRENTKMNYIDNIGKEWQSKKEYCKVLGKNINICNNNLLYQENIV